MRYRLPSITVSLFLANSAWAQYSTPVRIVDQPVDTVQSKEVINLVEQDIFPQGAAVTLPVDLTTVPPNKRLVITSAAVDTGLNSCIFSLNPRIRIARPSSPNLVMFPLGRATASTFGTPNPSYVNQMTYPVTIYADAGDTVRFDASRSSANCSSLFRVSITGYLEDNF